MKPNRRPEQWQADVDRHLEILREVDPFPSGLQDRIMAQARIRGAELERPSFGWLPQWALWPVGAAAAITALVLGGLSGSSTWRARQGSQPTLHSRTAQDSIQWEAPFVGDPVDDRWLTELALVEPEVRP